MNLSPEIVVALLAGAAAGGFLNGLAGFGTGLLSLGIWLQVLPPWQAVAIVAAMSVIGGVQGLWLIRTQLGGGMHRLPRFLVPALVGLPLGAAVLTRVEAPALKLFLAALMLLYGAFFLLRRSLPQLGRPYPAADAASGFLGGVLGGAVSLSGPIPSMWCALQPWTKGETSAVIRPYNVAILGVAAAIYAWQGYYTLETLAMIAIALPATLVSSHVGVVVFRRLDDLQFRRLLVWLLFSAGALLALHEWW